MANLNNQADLARKSAELKRLIKLGALTLVPLESDWKEATKAWQQDRTSQFWSRTAIRCLCAAIEARVFMFRQMAKGIAVLSGVQFDRKEVAILAEQRMTTTSGVQTIKPKWLPFPESVKESFRLFAKAAGVTLKVDYGVVGFAALCSTFEVRNRLMHPKQPFDVQVDVKDLDTADRGIHWFNETYTTVVDQCQAHLAQTIEAELQARGGARPGLS